VQVGVWISGFGLLTLDSWIAELDCRAGCHVESEEQSAELDCRAGLQSWIAELDCRAGCHIESEEQSAHCTSVVSLLGSGQTQHILCKHLSLE
jgi:hypothetical protein